MASHGPIKREAPVFERVGQAIGGDDQGCSNISFLFQRISVLVQRFNSVLLHNGFIVDDKPE